MSAARINITNEKKPSSEAPKIATVGLDLWCREVASSTEQETRARVSELWGQIKLGNFKELQNSLVYFDYYQDNRVAKLAEIVWERRAFQTYNDKVFIPLAEVRDRGNPQAKAMLYMDLTQTNEGGYSFSTLYYPEPRIMQRAYMFLDYSTVGGPGSFYPGSLSTCSGQFFPSTHNAVIHFLQSSINEKKLIKRGEITLVTPKTFRPYGGRMIRTAESTFGVLGQMGISEVKASKFVRSKSLPALDQGAGLAGFDVTGHFAQRWTKSINS